MAGADFDSIGRPRAIRVDVNAVQVDVAPAAGFLFELISIAIRWEADANVGQRRLNILVRNDDDETIYRRNSLIEQAESTQHQYVWSPGLPDEAAASATYNQLLTPMPLLLIGGVLGQGLVRISDDNGISAGDHITGTFYVREYAGPTS